MVAHLPMVIQAVCYAEYDKNLLRPCWLQTYRNINKENCFNSFIHCFIFFLKIKSFVLLILRTCYLTFDVAIATPLAINCEFPESKAGHTT